jgi:hypothetical protein
MRLVEALGLPRLLPALFDAFRLVQRLHAVILGRPPGRLCGWPGFPAALVATRMRMRAPTMRSALGFVALEANPPRRPGSSKIPFGRAGPRNAAWPRRVAGGVDDHVRPLWRRASRRTTSLHFAEASFLEGHSERGDSDRGNAARRPAYLDGGDDDQAGRPRALGFSRATSAKADLAIAGGWFRHRPKGSSRGSPSLPLLDISPSAEGVQRPHGRETWKARWRLRTAHSRPQSQRFGDRNLGASTSALVGPRSRSHSQGRSRRRSSKLSRL